MELLSDADLDLLKDAAMDINPGAVESLLVIEMTRDELIFALREIAEE